MQTRNRFLLVLAVWLAAAVAVQADKLELGTAVERELTKENTTGAGDWRARNFEVDLNAGDDLSVEATTPTGKVQLQIYVLSPTGKKIKVSGKDTSLSFSTDKVPAKGTYTVRVCVKELTNVTLRVKTK
jgi:hypothetical protein